jgi:hypothetical protein
MPVTRQVDTRQAGVDDAKDRGSGGPAERPPRLRRARPTGEEQPALAEALLELIEVSDRVRALLAERPRRLEQHLLDLVKLAPRAHRVLERSGHRLRLLAGRARGDVSAVPLRHS